MPLTPAQSLNSDDLMDLSFGPNLGGEGLANSPSIAVSLRDLNNHRPFGSRETRYPDGDRHRPRTNRSQSPNRQGTLSQSERYPRETPPLDNHEGMSYSRPLAGSNLQAFQALCQDAGLDIDHELTAQNLAQVYGVDNQHIAQSTFLARILAKLSNMESKVDSLTLEVANLKDTVEEALTTATNHPEEATNRTNNAPVVSQAVWVTSKELNQLIVGKAMEMITNPILEAYTAVDTGGRGRRAGKKSRGFGCPIPYSTPSNDINYPRYQQHCNSQSPAWKADHLPPKNLGITDATATKLYYKAIRNHLKHVRERYHKLLLTGIDEYHNSSHGEGDGAREGEGEGEGDGNSEPREGEGESRIVVPYIEDLMYLIAQKFDTVGKHANSASLWASTSGATRARLAYLRREAARIYQIGRGSSSIWDAVDGQLNVLRSKPGNYSVSCHRTSRSSLVYRYKPLLSEVSRSITGKGPASLGILIYPANSHGLIAIAESNLYFGLLSCKPGRGWMDSGLTRHQVRVILSGPTPRDRHPADQLWPYGGLAAACGPHHLPPSGGRPLGPVEIRPWRPGGGLGRAAVYKPRHVGLRQGRVLDLASLPPKITFGQPNSLCIDLTKFQSYLSLTSLLLISDMATADDGAEVQNLNALLQKSLSVLNFKPEISLASLMPGVSAASAEATRAALTENTEKYHCFFNDMHFHNHIAHHLLAMYALGAPPALIKAAFETEALEQRPALSPPSGEMFNEKNWTIHLGDDKYYPRYLSFFSAEVARLGAMNAVDHYVFRQTEGDMLNRSLGGVYHPIIHWGYGLEFSVDGIVAEGLAIAAVHSTEYRKLQFNNLIKISQELEGSSVIGYDNSNNKPNFQATVQQLRLHEVTSRARQASKGLTAFEILHRVAKDPKLETPQNRPSDLLGSLIDTCEIKSNEILHWTDQWHFQPKLDWTEILCWLVVAIYASSYHDGPSPYQLDFLMLHCVTSCISLPTILQNLSKASQKVLLTSYFRSVIALWVSRGRRPLHLSQDLGVKSVDPHEVESSKKWPALISIAMAHSDEHVTKVSFELVHTEPTTVVMCHGQSIYKRIFLKN
ncbi:uncharacterized protein MELLADRAFT_92312 [Melampsora larici-populina 98AG31]|uniref:Uncharacterized protein n=1 Tax=Melampsora larici-populina (strain 98AG31 / pathotype 3-4-7) TaxID=747676 RepID=F4R959_MELLP|nr:uncharacterized protein MELLADRAFT_92312 [Melampsora larici-populina 98AG31]EGG10926.1 hypothetical protein MELLADRAFT_92312 [Melampsora larici-populina 98AG31]